MTITLPDKFDPGLIIPFAVLICFTILYFNKAVNTFFARNPLLTASIDCILIASVCLHSGGLYSPFIPAFLFPVLVCATTCRSLSRLLLVISISVLALLMLGLPEGYHSRFFYYASITFTAVGLLIYTLVNHSFQLLFSYAIRDGLTGLYTHQYFYDQLSALTGDNSRPATFSLIMLDLDDFKRLNDEYGHLEGDRVLQEVAATIKSNVRDSDIVARYGGDEFGIILPGASRQLCSTVIQRLRSSIIDLGYFNDVSIGSALYPNEAREVYQLVDLADIRMYKEKKERRECPL